VADIDGNTPRAQEKIGLDEVTAKAHGDVLMVGALRDSKGRPHMPKDNSL
jgi:hypothetical protein